MALKKPGSGEQTTPRAPHIDPGHFRDLYPVTFDTLWGSMWDDGSPRLPARLSLMAYARRLQAQVDLGGTNLMVRVELGEPGCLWDALEAFLATDPIPWETNPWLGSDGKPVKKKG